MNYVYYVKQIKEVNGNKYSLMQYQPDSGKEKSFVLPASIGSPRNFTIDHNGKIYILGKKIACFDYKAVTKGLYLPKINFGKYKGILDNISSGPENNIYCVVKNKSGNMDLMKLCPEGDDLVFADYYEDVARGVSQFIGYDKKVRQFYGVNRSSTLLNPNGEYLFWVWQPDKNKTIREIVPQRGHKSLRFVYGATGLDRVYVISSEKADSTLQTLSVFDLEMRKEFIDAVNLKFWPSRFCGMTADKQGYVYGATSKKFFRIDAAGKGNINYLNPCPVEIEQGLALTKTGLYFKAGGELWRYIPQNWPLMDEYLPQWTKKIRSDHPRLFLTADNLQAVRQHAMGRDRKLLKAIIDRINQKLSEINKSDFNGNLGILAAQSAFCYQVTKEPEYLKIATKAMLVSLEYYRRCLNQKKGAGWWSIERGHFILAWDWLYNELTPHQRKNIINNFAEILNEIYIAEPPISRENLVGFRTGFYGADCLKWYVGATTLATESESELTRSFLVDGYNEHLRMLRHRSFLCGDDGGGNTTSLAYGLGAYPWAEENFFYTWHSCTDENMAAEWPHASTLAYYTYWNRIPSAEDKNSFMNFGASDTTHQVNNLYFYPKMMPLHLQNICNFYPDTLQAALSKSIFIQDDIHVSTKYWFIHPFLWDTPEKEPKPLKEDKLLARHFEGMGQIFMRSGTKPQDTYCLFTCGGYLTNHRNLDALNFIILHKGGLLAVDTGDYHSQNPEHVSNYFERSIAHNTLLIHQPGEPEIYHWSGKPDIHDGGQHKITGSKVKGFESHPEYVYAAGDATGCYFHSCPDIPEKVSLVTRQMVFLPPYHFVIFDRVTSTNPNYPKEWLLHTSKEPVLNQRIFYTDQGQARLFCKTLLPSNAVITKIGGPGKEFFVKNRNYSWDKKGENKYAELTDKEREIMGQWRVSVSPVNQNLTDYFLHVIQVGEPSQKEINKTFLIDNDNSYGIRIMESSQIWEIIFNKKGNLAGHITGSGRIKINRNLTEQIQPQAGMVEFGTE